MTLSTVALLFWAGTVAWMDLLWRRVRWWWSLVGLVGAGGFRLAVWLRDGFVLDEALVMLVVITAGYTLWKRHWWGGADAKTVMALVTALPTLGYVAVAGSLILIVSTAAMLARRGGRSITQLFSDVLHVVRSGATKGDRIPLAAVMVAAATIYLGFITLFR